MAIPRPIPRFPPSPPRLHNERRRTTQNNKGILSRYANLLANGGSYGHAMVALVRERRFKQAKRLFASTRCKQSLKTRSSSPPTPPSTTQSLTSWLSTAGRLVSGIFPPSSVKEELLPPPAPPAPPQKLGFETAIVEMEVENTALPENTSVETIRPPVDGMNKEFSGRIAVVKDRDEEVPPMPVKRKRGRPRRDATNVACPTRPAPVSGCTPRSLMQRKASEGRCNKQKRVLPPRRGFLANALLSHLEEELPPDADPITHQDVLFVVGDEEEGKRLLELCELDENCSEYAPGGPSAEIEVPKFRVLSPSELALPPAGSAHATAYEDTSNEVYARRHRKHELFEKKLKNRERERLAHERYRQQLAVEKLRNMIEANRLLPMAAFRMAEDRERERHEAQRQLLREAEGLLRRYEDLGFGGSGMIGEKRRREEEEIEGASLEGLDMDVCGRLSGADECVKVSVSRRLSHSHSNPRHYRIRQRHASPSPASPSPPTTSSLSSSSSSSELSTPPPLHPLPLASPQQPHEPKQDPSQPTQTRRRYSRSSSLAARGRCRSSSPFPSPGAEKKKPPLTTFIRPNLGLPSGDRKSARLMLAFGARMPRMAMETDFFLPEEEFGDAMRARLMPWVK
ncbi:uncharacterized protein VTP21DRAFT_9468 [Calcarisporiella thermophila]|uniref:uncharacterized protein n=1 Tax=Calcarisporiella thermophila TaxID=911321 RepID=UPI0037436F6D